jgi:hypothetical protein
MLTTATIVPCIQPCQSSTQISILFKLQLTLCSILRAVLRFAIFKKETYSWRVTHLGGCVHKWWMPVTGIHFLNFSWCLSVMCIYSKIAWTKKLPENPVQTLTATTRTRIHRLHMRYQNYLLTPRSRDLLEKLTSSQLLKKFSSFSKLESHPNPLVDTLTQPTHNRRLKRRWTSDLHDW